MAYMFYKKGCKSSMTFKEKQQKRTMFFNS